MLLSAGGCTPTGQHWCPEMSHNWSKHKNKKYRQRIGSPRTQTPSHTGEEWEGLFLYESKHCFSKKILSTLLLISEFCTNIACQSMCGSGPTLNDTFRSVNGEFTANYLAHYQFAMIRDFVLIAGLLSCIPVFGNTHLWHCPKRINQPLQYLSLDAVNTRCLFGLRDT